MAPSPMCCYMPPPLDQADYSLKDNEVTFFKSQTGIHDENQLREHILEIQAKAFAIHPYPCIRRLAFTTMKISTYAPYEKILKIGRERPSAIFLDLGCCFGNDTRKVIADGYPSGNVVASDLKPEFWELGHKLFKSSPETFPVTFLPGDIFDPDFLSPIVSPVSEPPSKPPPLSTLTSLTPLQHHISVIHTSAFFHLFSLSEQGSLAHLLGTLLSPIPESIILGSHIGEPDSREDGEDWITWERLGHSPTTWEQMWTGEQGVFKPGDVALLTTAKAVERGKPPCKACLLTWSVTRI